MGSYGDEEDKGVILLCGRGTKSRNFAELGQVLGYPLDVHLTHPFLRGNFTIVMCRIKLWVHATARGTRGKK